ncbi:MAG: hypothetical protein JWO69_398 [Thermoleophilia bacterium]|nr:hypothetical protein [Thermoleophilia bacterium]
MLISRRTFPRILSRSVAMLAALTVTALAPGQASAAPTLGSSVTFTPAASYPRMVGTELVAHVDADEGASFRVSASGSQLTTNIMGCSSDEARCTLGAGGEVFVMDDNDPSTNGAAHVNIRIRVTPSGNVPLVSMEGQGMDPMPRLLNVTLTPTGATTPGTRTGVAAVPVVTNPALQSELQMGTIAPIDGQVVQRGTSIGYRATLTRVGAAGGQLDVSVSLMPAGGGARAGITPGGTGQVVMLPNIRNVTVELPIAVGAGAADGVHQWRLVATWGADTEVGAVRSFTVPARPVVTPPPSTTPRPPAPAAVTPAPKPAPKPTPAPARDTTPPGEPITIEVRGAVRIRNLGRRLMPLRVPCPRDEKSCTLLVSIAWKPRANAPARMVARTVLRIRSGQVANGQLRLSATGRRLLRTHGRLRTSLLIKFSDAAGNAHVRRRFIVLEYRP